MKKVKKTFKSSNFCNISNFHNGLLEIHQRFKGHFLNELRVSFNNYIQRGLNKKEIQLNQLKHIFYFHI